MKTIIYCGNPEKDIRNRKLQLKLPNYLIRRKISIIREKIIARKYGTIYLLKVFGKYYPSECRRYYKKKMLRKYFDKLRAHWFEEREVHRLLYKANVLFKAKLTRKAFNEWQTYARKKKLVRQHARIVRHDYDELRLRNILCSWKRMMNCRKRCKLIRSNAIELYHLKYTFLLLLKFAKYHHDEIEANLLEVKSVLCGRFFVSRKYLRRWKIYIFQQKNDRILVCKATNYYRLKVCVIYFLRWQRYVCYKRTKYEIVGLCSGLYKDGLLKMVVQLWKNKTTLRIVEKKNMLLASEFYDDLSKRKLLKTWKRYVKHKLKGRRLKHKANFFHTMRLKEKVLSALSKHVTCCKNTKLAIQKLKLFYRRLLVMTVWNEWIKLIDKKNHSELRDKLLLAISSYEGNIRRKYLTKLVGHNTTQQRKKALKLKAVDLCKTFYCKKCLNIWKAAYRRKIRVSMLEEKAKIFFNDSLMRNAILEWIKSYNDRISMKAKYKKSVLHYGRKLINKCFASWIHYCNEKIRTENLINEAREYYLEMIQRKLFNKLSMNVVRRKIKRGKIQVVENLYRKNLVIKGFANWRKHCIQVKELKIKVEEFDERKQSKLIRKIIMQWKLYVYHKKCTKRKALKSVTHERKKVCSRIFEKLKIYVNYKNEKNFRLSYLRHGVEGIQQNFRRIYFQRWRVARLNVLKEKCRMFHADEFHESHLKHKYFRLWQTFLTQHKIKRQHHSHLNNIISCFVLKKYLRVWYARNQTLSENHIHEKWASKIYEMKIRYKHFVVWKYFSEISLREKREINNAKELHTKLVVKEGLQRLIKLFLCNTELRFETQLRDVERNSAHEFESLRKYFNKWHKVVSTRANNRLQAIKDQVDLENVISISSKINDKNYVYDSIPRFVIPEFMKKEIKLRFGLVQCANKIAINANGKVMLQSDRILKANHFLVDQKLSKNIFHSGMHGNSKGNVRFKLKSKSENYKKFTNNDISPQHFRLHSKMMSPNKIPHILSLDSLESDSDSAKTYTVKNHRNNSLRPEVSGKKYNKENNDKSLPPEAFCVLVKE